MIMDLVQDVIDAKSLMDAANRRLSLFLKSEEPLTERWNIYLMIEDTLKLDSCYANIHISGAPEMTYYDDLYTDRYGTITHSNIIECITDGAKWSAVQIDELKERFLQTGYGGCINDW